MRKTIAALAMTALLSAPGMAGADPISVSVYGGGATMTDFSASGKTIDFGLGFGLGTPVYLLFDVASGVNYQVNMALPTANWRDVSVEVLNSALGGGNGYDPVQPDYVPEGWSTSNKFDGYSFAQGSGLDRSLLVGSTAFALSADENTHAHDLLSFSGAASGAGALSFGLRTYNGSGAFLVRLVANGADSVPTPEPASMLLMGAGLIGAAGAIRRRARTKAGKDLH